MVVEQAILFAINFNLNVGVETHATLAKRLLESLDLWVTTANPPPEEAEAHEIKLKLFQFTVIFLNDSVKTTLCLQFPPSQLAMVALTMAAKRYASAKYGGTNLPPILARVVALASDAGWFGSQGLTLEQAAGGPSRGGPAWVGLLEILPVQAHDNCLLTVQRCSLPAEIEAQFSELYGTAPAGQQQQATAAAQPAAKPEAVAQPAATAAAQAADVEEGEVAVTNVAADGGVLLPPPEPLSAPAEAGQAQQAMTMSCDAPGEHTFAQQQCQQPRRSPHHMRRTSDLEVAVPGEQHATSSLQAAPEMPDADVAAPTCGHGSSHVDTRLEDSANENFSPNGLTNGNASGSGCAKADGQPEVCSTGHERAACGAGHRLAGGKRRFCEEEGLGGATTNDPQSVTPGRSPGKVRRLEDSGEHLAVA